MAKQTQRSPVLQGFLDNFAKKAFGHTATHSTASNACVSCHKPAVRFKDELSRKEYAISGMCQACQDKVFG